MKALELRIPPLALVVLFGAAMWGIGRQFPQADLVIPARPLWIAALVALAFAIATAGVVAFRRHATTVDPRTPEMTTTLVATGIYRRSRNPMYVGFLLLLAGWAFFVANWAAAILLPLFVLYMNRFQIRPEERALRQKFGAAFDTYAAAVRRWL
jgi:protein-S-isoprenylcysteine O-methyltransferase Ste14